MFLYQNITLIFLHCTVMFFNNFFSYYITLCFYHLSERFIRPVYQTSLSYRFIIPVYQTSLSGQFIRPFYQAFYQTSLSNQFIRLVYQTILSGQFIIPSLCVSIIFISHPVFMKTRQLYQIFHCSYVCVLL